jgi:hypothetical protein
LFEHDSFAPQHLRYFQIVLSLVRKNLIHGYRFFLGNLANRNLLYELGNAELYAQHVQIMLSSVREISDTDVAAAFFSQMGYELG